MTRLEKTLQSIIDILHGGHLERPKLDELIISVESLIVREAFMDAKPLTKLQAVSILAGIPNKTPFTVVFRTKKDDIREMFCIVDTDESKGTQAAHSDTFTVWDREKKAPRSFRLDRVYRIEVSS